MRLFKKSFLEKLEKECGAKTMVSHYMDDQGMSFHDAILRFANFHSIEPEYIDRRERLNPEDTKKIIGIDQLKEFLGICDSPNTANK